MRACVCDAAAAAAVRECWPLLFIHCVEFTPTLEGEKYDFETTEAAAAAAAAEMVVVRVKGMR